MNVKSSTVVHITPMNDIIDVRPPIMRFKHANMFQKAKIDVLQSLSADGRTPRIAPVPAEMRVRVNGDGQA